MKMGGDMKRLPKQLQRQKNGTEMVNRMVGSEIHKPAGEDQTAIQKPSTSIGELMKELINLHQKIRRARLHERDRSLVYFDMMLKRESLLNKISDLGGVDGL